MIDKSYPLNSLLVDTNFLEFEENCVFNTEFEEGLENLYPLVVSSKDKIVNH